MSRLRQLRLLAELVAGLLLVRLVLLLWAARPSNPVVAFVLTITDPLVWPFARLDHWARQPRFGARFELATVAALLVIGLALAVATWRGGKDATAA